MGKADVYESDYLENEEIFADLVNGVLYNGEQVVKPQELEEQDGELRSALGNVFGSDVKKVVRDKVRLWKGTMLAVLAVENQTRVDYRMVTRAMLSEAMAYDKQWKRMKSKLSEELRERAGSEEESAGSEEEYAGSVGECEGSVEECAVSEEEYAESVLKNADVMSGGGAGEAGITPDEFISGMRKEDKFAPVITIVVYYGKGKSWDGATELYELLDVEGNKEKILPFISNYRLNLFDYHDYEEFGQFHSELQSVFEFLRFSGDKEQMKEKMEEHRDRYEDLSREAKILLSKLTNIKKIPGVGEKEFERGEFDMCKAFEDMKEEGREEGKIEGKAEERENGIRSALNIIKEFSGSREQGITALIKEYRLSREKAMEKVALYW